MTLIRIVLAVPWFGPETELKLSISSIFSGSSHLYEFMLETNDAQPM